MRIPSLRDVYDAVEKQVTPRAEQFARTDQAAQLSAVLMQVRRAAARRIDGVSARLLHTVNLPAGTDINRLRRQLGELDREVRQLRLELARERDSDRPTTRPESRTEPGEEVRRDAEHHRTSGGPRPGPT